MLTLGPLQGLGKTVTALALILKTQGSTPRPPPGTKVRSVFLGSASLYTTACVAADRVEYASSVVHAVDKGRAVLCVLGNDVADKFLHLVSRVNRRDKSRKKQHEAVFH